MMRTMGYIPEDYNEVYKIIETVVKNKFLSGEYKLQALNNHGQHFSIKLLLNGKRDHVKEKFNCHVGCVAWPYGKIKIATPLIKD